MKINLTENNLICGGNTCSSVTVYELSNGTYKICMFDNPKYMKTKIKHDKYFGNVKVTVGKRHTIVIKKVEFLGLLPRKVMYQERNYYHRINKNGNYINLYKHPGPYSMVVE